MEGAQHNLGHPQNEAPKRKYFDDSPRSFPTPDNYWIDTGRDAQVGRFSEDYRQHQSDGCDLKIIEEAHSTLFAASFIGRFGKNHRRTALAHPTNSVRRIEVIQHQINQNSRDRNVEPHGQGPTRQSPVTHKISAQGPAQGNYDKRHDDHREHRVRSQDRKIDWSRNPLPRKACRTMM